MFKILSTLDPGYRLATNHVKNFEVNLSLAQTLEAQKPEMSSTKRMFRGCAVT